MEVKANLKHLRISPRKARLVVSLVRGLEVNKAVNQLKFLNKKSAKPVLKLLNSAIANAVNNYDLDKNNLIIKEIRVEDGKTLKRWMPRAYGRATVIRKRMCHIYIVLSEIVASGKKEAKKLKVEAPVKLEDLGKKSKTDKQKDKTDKNDINKKENIDKEEKIVDDKINKSGNKNFASKVFRRKSG